MAGTSALRKMQYAFWAGALFELAGLLAAGLAFQRVEAPRVAPAIGRLALAVCLMLAGGFWIAVGSRVSTRLARMAPVETVPLPAVEEPVHAKAA